MSRAQRPIGVFDSGVGGLTVVDALRRRLPAERILYLGDTARLPYGTKSGETVTHYTRANVRFLLERGVKAVVVACNTASALALPHLEAAVPTWGVIEPGAQRAAAVSRRRVGVVATESTVRSGAYAAVLRRLRPELEVLSQPCPLFVPLVEEGWLDDAIAEQVAERYLAPLKNAAIDTLVLGCTHYPLLAPMLRRLVGESVTLVDSAEAVAATVGEGLAGAGLLAPAAPSAPVPEHHLCVTDASDCFARLARRILGPVEARLELVELAAG